ncbi:ImmA/IrrE family metallo-endopeptidase [Deinococcus lacus]|uniref:ImmA/IrrE family metallo-endopeptidase n=1 Tax=Deinococcus lacus TaxID=392561 RepID=A0ABW1YBM6_9DEIO
MKTDPVVKLLEDVQQMLEAMNWPTPYEVARALDLRVISGPVPAINLEPPPTIHLPTTLVGFKRAHTLAHEIAHVMLDWREIDDELLAYYAPECAYSNLEALANHIAGLICFPQPFLDETLGRFGFSPEALLFMAQAKDAPLPLAMDRVVYASDDGNRAALLFKKGYLIDFSATLWLEAERYDFVDEPLKRFPGIQLQPLPGGTA